MPTVVISGASKGIGFETALKFAENGYQVYAIARSEDRLKTLQDVFPELIIPMALDLTDESAITQSFHELSNETKIEILINNAGSLLVKPFQELSIDDWKSMMDLNVYTAVRLTKATLPFMKGGHIVNVSSMGGLQGSSKFPGLSAYSAAKGALSILSECLATELADQNISVNALCLGAVQTDMLEQAFPGYKAPVTAAEMGKYIYTFATESGHIVNGHVLPVSLSNPS